LKLNFTEEAALKLLADGVPLELVVVPVVEADVPLLAGAVVVADTDPEAVEAVVGVAVVDATVAEETAKSPEVS